MLLPPVPSPIERLGLKAPGRDTIWMLQNLARILPGGRMSDALHVLVFVVILLVFFGVWRSVLNRGMGRAAGWAFAGWTAGQPWRPVVLCALVGLAALAVAVWSGRLNAPVLIIFFVVAPLCSFLVGLAGHNGAAGGAPRNSVRWHGQRKPSATWPALPS